MITKLRHLIFQDKNVVFWLTVSEKVSNTLKRLVWLTEDISDQNLKEKKHQYKKLQAVFICNIDCYFVFLKSNKSEMKF